MRFSDLDVFALSDGTFALDGGAMFGVVPRVFWQKTNPPDERNRITLALRPLLVKTDRELIVVDTGIGDKEAEKFRDVYRVTHTAHLVASLQDAGFQPEQVTGVINTHLHFDHCGGNTVRDAQGKAVTTFPNAKYYIQEKEWDLAMNPDVRSKASYLPENYMPIQQAGQLALVRGDHEIVPGVSVINTGGHTGGHQSVMVESAGKRLVYWGDLIPTVSHINVPYVMGYDTAPLVTIEQKERLLKQAVAEHWLMCFEHDPEVAFGYLLAEQGKFTVKPVNQPEGLAQGGEE